MFRQCYEERRSISGGKTKIQEDVKPRKERERQVRKQLDVINSDMKAAAVCTDDAGDLVKWRFNTEVTDPGYLVKEAKEKGGFFCVSNKYFNS